MKNITAFTVLVIIFFLFAVNNSAYSQEQKERKYSLSTGTQFGFIYGQALELVYPLPNNTKGGLLSELLWNMKPVFYYGVQLDFSRFNIMSGPGFFASLGFKAGIPGNSGTMEDRDWWSTENDSLTVFSSHKNNTSEFFYFNADIGASFPVKTYFYVKPFISGSWTRFSFTGSDGYGLMARQKSPTTYYPITDNPQQYTFTGEVIRYKQDWLLIACGFSIGTKILSPFSIELSFQISPFNYCAATDDHLTTNSTFKDFTFNGFYIEPGGSFSFSVERLEFIYEFTYRYIGRTRGESYSKYTSSDYILSNNESGAGLSIINSRFLVKVHL
jgi:outer membrane protease